MRAGAMIRRDEDRGAQKGNDPHYCDSGDGEPVVQKHCHHLQFFTFSKGEKTMSESIEIRASRLLAQYRIFNGQLQADLGRMQRDRKSITLAMPTPTPKESTDERMYRIHNRKPSPALNTAPAIPVTKIRTNGAVVADYEPVFTKSGGEEFNLKNGGDQFAFMEQFWPDFPRERWPALFNSMLVQGRISKDEAPGFVRQMKARVV